MKLNKILIGMLVLIISLGAVNAAAGLNIVLANQNPDPVSPGNFVYLNVKVANSGSADIKDVSITMVENANFRIANGEDLTEFVGNVPAFSTLDGSTATIAKFKILVDEDTPIGLNTIKFRVDESLQSSEYSFDVLVQDDNPILYVKDIESEQIKPGEVSSLTINLENVNSIDLNNVKVALDLANVDDKIITMAKGSNEKIIESVKAGNEDSLVFDITISPEAESKSYLLPIMITYDDALENTYTNTVYGSVKVYSEPDLSLVLDSQDVYTTGRGKFSLAIANPGTSKIKGVQIKILPSDDYEMIEGANQYVGDLNPDDFQTLQGDIYIKNSEAASLKVLLTYSDSYDVKNEESVEIPLKIYSDEQLKEYGFTNNSGGSGITYLVLLLIAGVVFIVWRNHKKKKHLKHARS